MDKNVSLLTEEEIFREDGHLKIFDTYGTLAAVTDFSVLLDVSMEHDVFSVGSSTEGRPGEWLTSSSTSEGIVGVVDIDGNIRHYSVTNYDAGVRPAIIYSEIAPLCSNETVNEVGIKEVEYGEYPQSIVSEDYSEVLEDKYKAGKNIRKTGRTFTIADADSDKGFIPKKLEEYEVDGKKYIRFESGVLVYNNILSDGRKAEDNQVYWLNVEPIKWMVDNESGVALSKYILFSGIQYFHDYEEIVDEIVVPYSHSDIKSFLDTYFSKEIINTKKTLDKIDLDFLTLKQIEDEIVSPMAKQTELSILTGGFIEVDNNYGYYWTKDMDHPHAYSFGDARFYDKCISRNCGIRPVVRYSSIKPYISKNDSSYIPTDEYGYKIVCFGEYPQRVASEVSQTILNINYPLYEAGDSSCGMHATGRVFTFDSSSMSYDEYRGFTPTEYEEIQEDDSKLKFIRVKCNLDDSLVEYESEYGITCEDDEYVWVWVEPVEWIVNEELDLAVSKNILLSGIQFDDPSLKNEDFNKTIIKQFLDNYMSKELVQGIPMVNNMVEEVSEETKIEKKTRLDRINPDNTNPVDRKKMTYNEILSFMIESGHSVLLRGPSGIGKTERIKTLYPDLIYVKLTNNMFPEKIVGSMNLQTGQSIPPDYAKQALMLCANEEERKLVNENIQNLYDVADEIYERSKNSNEKVVILLDELLNVKPAVQSLVYTLVLNKIVESGNGLKLPANTVVVATGNQKKYSSVAEDLVEPLEKRFDHIIDMQPKVGEWVYEYAIPNKVHPAVVGYILSNYLQNKRSEEIGNMGYFYEEPEVGEKSLDKYGCKGRTNDPRGWVSISNTLYAFEEDLINGKFVGKDVEHLFEVSIKSKLRDEWANSFIDYYNIPVLSVEEVSEEDYSNADLPRDINERFACVMSLLTADDSQVEKCRSFIRKYCDPEYLSLYDMCWVGNDENRMIKITELQEMEKTNREGESMRR